ncbi:unnamed protein product [Symbiodinium sp. KB8]|nr:unnamed protein product [Symbiodinium sp. KB8]
MFNVRSSLPSPDQYDRVGQQDQQQGTSLFDIIISSLPLPGFEGIELQEGGQGAKEKEWKPLEKRYTARIVVRGDLEEGAEGLRQEVYLDFLRGLFFWQGNRVCLGLGMEEFRFGPWDEESTIEYCGRKIMEGKEGIHVKSTRHLPEPGVQEGDPGARVYFPYGAMDIESATILSITHASHSGRLLLALASPEFINEGRGQVYLLSYRSNVILWVCRSTQQAETLSMIAGYEEAMDKHRVIMLTDCKSLEEHAKQPGLYTVNDKRLTVDLCGVRQVIWRQEVSDPLFSDKPPQDGSTQNGLTKLMRSPQLDELMHKATMGVSFVKIGLYEATATLLSKLYSPDVDVVAALGGGRAAVLALEGGAGAAGSCGATAVAAAGNPARPDMTSVADGGIRPADFMHVSCVGSKAAQACPSFP